MNHTQCLTQTAANPSTTRIVPSIEAALSLGFTVPFVPEGREKRVIDCITIISNFVKFATPSYNKPYQIQLRCKMRNCNTQKDIFTKLYHQLETYTFMMCTKGFLFDMYPHWILAVLDFIFDIPVISPDRHPEQYQDV